MCSQLNHLHFLTSGYRSGSAALSSVNAAGYGVLMKAYKPLEPFATGTVNWVDTQVSYMEILDHGFPGQGDDTRATWGGLSAPVLAEFSGTIVFPNQGIFMLALACDGWCNLSLYGSLLVESKPTDDYHEPAQCSVNVDKAGPFPYRILYYQSSGKLGVSLRWSLDSGDIEAVPPDRLFTDSHMEYATSGKLLTGSLAGALTVPDDRTLDSSAPSSY